MAGIAGINKGKQHALVNQMLQKMSHRGNSGYKIIETADTTIGVIWPAVQKDCYVQRPGETYVEDSAGQGHSACAEIINEHIVLERDELGAAPLYYGRMKDDTLSFASEVKSLLIVVTDVNELPPGYRLENNKLSRYYTLQKKGEIKDDPEMIAKELRRLLERSVSSVIRTDTFGSWLSGGLDSSSIAAVARPHLKHLHTFSAGIKDAPDLLFAREVASFIKSVHHEVIVDLAEMVEQLPMVIFHLESFDALLVRSAVVNYIAAKAASDYVEDIFSGEGGDELFAGYSYLKNLPMDSIADELIDITGRLHNTALQRVDRSASAHSTIPHIVFADPDIVNYALTIPAKYKLKDGVEKWILREAVKDILPSSVLSRTKSKFWEGAGVNELLSDYASKKISDADFRNERVLPNGWEIFSKEELFYYRIFKEYFSDAEKYDWMGRTKRN